MNDNFILIFQDIGGDIFDCIDINKQPALEHPLPKNHKIQVTFKFIVSDSYINIRYSKISWGVIVRNNNI